MNPHPKFTPKMLDISWNKNWVPGVYTRCIDTQSGWSHPTRHSSLTILQCIVIIYDEITSHGPHLWSRLSAFFAPFPVFDFNSRYFCSLSDYNLQMSTNQCGIFMHWPCAPFSLGTILFNLLAAHSLLHAPYSAQHTLPHIFSSLPPHCFTTPVPNLLTCVPTAW